MLPKTILEVLYSETSQANIHIGGWVKTKRNAKGFVFLELNDGSCLKNIQCIVDESSPAWASIGDINTGACISVYGDLIASPGKGQRWEIHVKEIVIHGLADPETYPLQKKRHSDEFLRTIAHLRIRTNKYSAIFRIRSETAQAIHNYFYQRGFYYIHTPILTGSDCEGAGEMFRVTTGSCLDDRSELNKDFFGKECSLTVSGQLEAECLAMGLGKVYTFGPTFRAENSNTPRHAAEFWMVEPEVAFANLEDNMDLAEDLLCTVIQQVLEHRIEDITLLDNQVEPGLIKRLEQICSKPFVRCSYRDAIHLLQSSRSSFEFPVAFGLDLQVEHEKYITELYFKQPVIIFDYPKEIKAFYMRQNEDGETVAAMDVLIPNLGELIGGSQREERLNILLSRMRELGQSIEEYWWYLDLRRFGTVPHAGFGLGFERLVMLLTGVSNIRDVLPFPRTPGVLEF